MLKQRILTALVLLPVALAGFFLLDGWAFALFVGAVIVLGAWEWARLAGFTSQTSRLSFAALVGLLLVGLYVCPFLSVWVLGFGLGWWLLAVGLVAGFPASSRYWQGRFRRSLIGLLILLPAWQGLVLLKSWTHANQLIIAVMLLVWCADIGAYFVGKRFGRRKLAPRVSPGKSWEGLLGGLSASLSLTLLAGLLDDWELSGLLLALSGATLVVFSSVLGDLTESMFKRQAGIKDSSQLLPGHGGVLDRIDSLTAAVPVFAALLLLAGWGHP